MDISSSALKRSNLRDGLIWVIPRKKSVFKSRIFYLRTERSILPSLLREAATMATVPEAIAARWHTEHGLTVVDCPVPLDEVVVSAAWLAVRETDAPLRWLREVLSAAARDAGVAQA